MDTQIWISHDFHLSLPLTFFNPFKMQKTVLVCGAYKKERKKQQQQQQLKPDLAIGIVADLFHTMKSNEFDEIEWNSPNYNICSSFSPVLNSREHFQVFKFRILNIMVSEINGNCIEKKQTRMKHPIVWVIIFVIKKWQEQLLPLSSNWELIHMSLNLKLSTYIKWLNKLLIWFIHVNLTLWDWSGKFGLCSF